MKPVDQSIDQTLTLKETCNSKTSKTKTGMPFPNNVPILQVANCGEVVCKHIIGVQNILPKLHINIRMLQLPYFYLVCCGCEYTFLMVVIL